MYYIDLSLAKTSGEIPDHLVAALSVRDSARQRRSSDIIAREYLKNKQSLLVMDNFEQIKFGDDYLTQLLGACRGVKILVTSRATVGVGSEHEYSLPPLRLPERGFEGTHALSAESVRLFFDRAGRHSRINADERTIESVAGICRRLDGMPLAIELAAPQLKFMTPGELLQRLKARIGWLETRDHSVPERQRTMETAIGWSYDLLDDHQKRLFRLLSVFAGTWSLEAAESIFGPMVAGVTVAGSSAASTRQPGTNVVALIESLVEQNLIVRVMSGEETRYRMLQSIGEFASDRLSGGPDEAPAREHHARHFFDRAQRGATELHGAAAISWLDSLELDYANLVRAIEWYEKEGEAIDEIALAVSLVWYWYLHGHFADGRRILEQALSRTGADNSSKIVGRGYRALGWMSFVEGNYGTAIEILHHALSVTRNSGDAYGESEALASLGMSERFRGNESEAVQLFDESLRVAREVGDELLLMYALNWAYASAGGKFAGIQPFAQLEEALRLSRKTGDPWSYAHIQNGLGDLLRETGDLPAARAAYEDSLARMEVVNDRWIMAWNYEGLGATSCLERRRKAGIRDYRRALRLFVQLGDVGDTLDIVGRIACAMASLEMFAEVAPLLAALPALHAYFANERPDTGDTGTVSSGDTEHVWQMPAELRTADKRCREEHPTEWGSGRSMSLDAVVSRLESLFSLARIGAGDE